jgi:hypothetical protein
LDDIAEATLKMEAAKRVRAEHAGDATTSSGIKLKNLGNIMELLSGAAESTGHTTKKIIINTPGAVLGAATTTAQGVGKVGYEVVKGTSKLTLATGKAGYDVVKGTGRIGIDVVKGTGQLTKDIVVGTGKVSKDIVVGTGKVSKDLVVGTTRLGYDVVVGTVMGTTNAVKSTGKRMSRMMSSGTDDESTVSSEALGYETTDTRNNTKSTPSPPQADKPSIPRSFFNRRASGSSTSPSSGTPAMGPPEGVAMNRKARRRGSTNMLVESFNNSFGNLFLSRSSGSGRRRASMDNTDQRCPPKHSKSAPFSPDNNLSELERMEHFLNYVKESDPQHMKQVIGHAYRAEDKGDTTPKSPLRRPEKAERRRSMNNTTTTAMYERRRMPPATPVERRRSVGGLGTGSSESKAPLKTESGGPPIVYSSYLLHAN